jgi:hypothetical protein
MIKKLFLMSLVSVSEIDTLISIVVNLKYSDGIGPATIQQQNDDIKKMLTSFIKSLKNN